MGPPPHHRGGGQQQGDHDAVAVPREGAVQPQDDHLAGPGVTADPDLGVETAGATLVAADQGDDAAGMLTARVLRRLDRLVGLGLVDDDDQGEHPSERHGAHVVAQPDQLLADGGRGGAGQVDDHGFLQVRPSRRIMSPALAGPHPPEG